jgi:flagellar assembly protein FliH
MLTRLLEEAPGVLGPLIWSAETAAHATPPSGAKAKEPACVASEQQITDAFEAGVREGEARTATLAEQQVRTLAARTANTIAELASTRAQVLARAQIDVVRLSLDIARRVLHREVGVDPDALGALVSAALKKLGAQERYRVRVHPAHLVLVRSCLGELRPGAEVDIVADSALAEGSIVFEGAQGVLDASIETQLQEIERGLVDELGQRA